MGEDQAERVLRTGGPLRIWRREVERRGEDYITPMLDEIEPEDMGKAMLGILDRMVGRLKSWGPAQYIKGFPPELAPELIVRPDFDQMGLRATVSTKNDKYRLLGGPSTILHYAWSPGAGYLYHKMGILRFLTGIIAESLKVAGYTLHDCSNPRGILQFMVSYRRPDGFPERWRGEICEEDVFDYNKIQALVRRIITGEDDE